MKVRGNLVQLHQHGKSYVVTIPRHILFKLKWHLGDYIALNLRGTELVAESIADHRAALKATPPELSPAAQTGAGGPG
jgi:antitoxin component of MazEF toxin-antitoxin module